MKAKGKLRGIDSTSVKVHKHGFGSPLGAEFEQIGNSRGGANTKIHAVVDSRGRAIKLLLSPGNRNDILYAPDLVKELTDCIILADKAYDTDGFRR